MARDGGVDVPGAVGVHPDRAAGPERVADGLDPGQVVGQRSGVVGDLDLGGAAAGPATIACARAGSTAGTVTLTGTRSRTGAGQPTVACSTAVASQAAASSSPYSGNGQNSPQPAGPAISIPSRTSMPRKRVRSGIA